MPLEDLSDCTVLIVDDSTDSLALMAQGLGDLYHVKAAKTGELAFHILKKFPVDLILLDVVMPELSGYDVIRQLKSDLRYNDIPVVFLTGKSLLADEKLGFELGAIDIFINPLAYLC